MYPIEQRLPFFCQIELRGWDVAASRNTKFTLAGNSIVQVAKFSRMMLKFAIIAIWIPVLDLRESQPD